QAHGYLLELEQRGIHEEAHRNRQRRTSMNSGLPKIVVLDDWENAMRDLVDWGPIRRGAQVSIHSSRLRGPALDDALAGANVLVLLRERTPVDADLIRSLPGLRRIVYTGARNRTLDIDAA